MARALTVPAELDGERLDKVVASLLAVSRAEARRLVESGARVDGEAARPADRVGGGSVVEVPASEGAAPIQPEEVAFDVVYEDRDLIVVDKPAGVVVHPGASRPRGTLAAGLLHRYPELARVGPEGRSGLVHRLDKDTSGVLLVARSDLALERLGEALRQRRIGRIYLALAHGLFATPTGTVDAPISGDPQRPTRRAVVAGGRPARTHYRVAEPFPGFDVSLLEVTLETGRTHQIRVHLAAIGHPLVGDRTYSKLGTPLAVPRTFLHSRSVTLEHPRTGVEMTFEAPLPPDLGSVLAELRRAGVT